LTELGQVFADAVGGHAEPFVEENSLSVRMAPCER
jgi:hypothetical protein